MNLVNTSIQRVLKNKISIIFLLLGAAVGLIIIKSAASAIFFTLAIIISIVFINNPLKALSILILLTPFSGLKIFEQPIINLPGAKPLHLLVLFVIFIALINYNQSVKMPKTGFYFTLVLLSFFSVAIFRSLPNLNLINVWNTDKLTIPRYLLSEYIKPLIYFTPLIIISKFLKSKQQLNYIINIIVVAVTILAIFILYLYFFKVPDKTDVGIISAYYSDVLTLHRNNLATFFILSFPLLVAKYFIKKSPLNITFIIISLVSIGFLYSRGAYFTVLFSFLFYLFISKRKRYLPVLIAILITASMFLSQSIIKRASLGFNSGDYDEVSAGRIDFIWIPIIKEFFSQPYKLILGNGRYAIIASQSLRRGRILEVKHPHNMFLEMVIDSGLIGLFVFLYLYFFLIRRLYGGIKDTTDPLLKEYKYALTVSVISFLISGLTDRSLFPNLENCFLWSILGITFVLMNIKNFNEPNIESNLV